MAGTYAKYAGGNIGGSGGGGGAFANQSLSNLTSPTAVNQPLLEGDGTVSAPSYSFTSEPGLGLYRSGSHQLSVADNGKQEFIFEDNGSGGGSLFLPIDPSSLQIGAGSVLTGHVLDLLSNVAGTTAFLTQNTANTSAPILTLQKSRGGAFSTPSPVLAGDNLGTIRFSGYNGTGGGATYSTSGDITYTAFENFSSSARGGTMTFHVAKAGTNGGQEVLQLNNDGSAAVPGSVVTPLVDGDTVAGSYNAYAATGGVLNLNSTSNATKGYVQISDDSGFLFGDSNALTAGIAGSVTGTGAPPASFYMAFDAAGPLFQTFNNLLSLDVYGGAVFFNFGATSGTLATPTYFPNGHSAGGLTWTTWNGNSPEDQNIASVDIQATETQSASAFGTELRFRSTNNGGTSVVVSMTLNGNDVVLAPNGALSTSATVGFTFVPSCAGAPTGTPTTRTGAVPMVVDTTDSKLYFYIGGTWKSTTLA
jgi:hypothetical protein